MLFRSGSFYYILNLMAQNNLFIGVDKPSTFNLENFLNHLYISLGSLTTVGSGSISPLNAYIRLLCVLETILGIFLTSFSLGFIFSALGATLPPTPQEDSTLVAQQNPSVPTKKFPLFWGTVDFLKKIKSDLDDIENTSTN